MYVVQAPFEPPTIDTCDFDAFVAERRGIAGKEASALIASWLANYKPRGVAIACCARGMDQSSPLDELLVCA